MTDRTKEETDATVVTVCFYWLGHWLYTGEANPVNQERGKKRAEGPTEVSF